MYITLDIFLAQLSVGISRAMIYFIVASGLTLSFGMLRIINVSHATLYMLGVYIAWSIITSGYSYWTSIFGAALVVAGISALIEKGILRRIYQKPHFVQVLVTFSLVFIINDLIRFFWGADYKSISVPKLLTGNIPIYGVHMGRYNIFLVIVGLLVSVGLWYLFYKTRLGKIARAATTNREMVAALGINVNFIFAMVFIIGGALAGLGGALIAPTTSISLGMDMPVLITTFFVVIIGGLGNIWGALISSIILGIGEAIGLLIIPQFAIVIPYVIAVIIVSLKPTGLLKSLW